MNTLRNKVSLIGRLGGTPEFKEFGSGAQIARLNIATNESYRDKNGEWVENTQWHSVVAWGKQVDRVKKLLTKGVEVIVEGRLVNRSWETTTGEKRYATEIEMSEFLILSPKASK